MSDSTLRNRLIRLAHANAELRPFLVPLIEAHGKAANFPADEIGAVTKMKGIPGGDQDQPWAKGEFTQQENAELLKKQEAGQLSDGKADDAPAKVARSRKLAESLSTELRHEGDPKSHDQNLPNHWYGLPPRTASEKVLRERLVRLAAADPNLRSVILPLLRDAADNGEGSREKALKEDADPKSHDQNLAETWEKVSGKKKVAGASRIIDVAKTSKDASVLATLSKHPDPKVRAGVAKNPACPPAVHMLLMLKDVESVSEAASRNPFWIAHMKAQEAEVERLGQMSVPEMIEDWNEKHPTQLWEMPKTGGFVIPGVYLIQDYGDKTKLVFRERGGDILRSETNPGYYASFGGLLKQLVKAEEQSAAGEAKARRAMDLLIEKANDTSPPDPKGSNWVRRTISGLKHWVWVSPTDKGPIDALRVIRMGPGEHEGEYFLAVYLMNRKVKVWPGFTSRPSDLTGIAAKIYNDPDRYLPMLDDGPMPKFATSKTASGPDPKGRGWKEMGLDGSKHSWVWVGRGGDPSFTVTEHAAPFGLYYKLSILLPDGNAVQTVGQKLEKEHWFKRAAALYNDFHSPGGFDLSMQPEKWKRL